jgi:hypothetical protein
MAKRALLGPGPMGTPRANRPLAGHGSAVIGTAPDRPGSLAAATPVSAQEQP